MSKGASGLGTVSALAIRWLVGGMFFYMGLNKALDPVAFLKLVRQYDLIQTPPWINIIAAGLPWFEMFCGLLLVLGLAVRGTALLVLAMIVPFTWLVTQHALELQATGNLAFCAIKFDCGCGTGEVFICRKLAENVLLALGSILLVFRQRHRWCLWPRA